MPALFYPECDPVEPGDAPHHIIYSCLQWKGPNLEALPHAAKQTFCFLYGDFLDDRVIKALEHMHIRGAMSPVKLIAFHDDCLSVFLDSATTSDTIPALEAMWEKFVAIDPIRLYHVSFSSEADVYAGRSDYPYWGVVQEILESNSLGIADYEPPAFDHGEDEINSDEWPFSTPLGVCGHTGLAPSSQSESSYGQCFTCLFIKFHTDPKT
ncbi:hypothetical protein IFT98_05055 [Pseudomonas sp. CFBP 8770]|uniref:hypothetical protein n=1 Tax=unclassified Pseudomonas TaxID=196821 RepID=UPI0017843B5D|nr:MULTISPECIES: hypothetical protein [unclassified Pseudomonas]MBD8473227.1 hypothetical protein [Pseudomonas sp. CFBP 8773]MBD8646354.1 hypothetical protein [Pseudomonas sp. CFBP 8770]